MLDWSRVEDVRKKVARLIDRLVHTRRLSCRHVRSIAQLSRTPDRPVVPRSQHKSRPEDAYWEGQTRKSSHQGRPTSEISEAFSEA